MGFALFATAHQAVAAKDILQVDHADADDILDIYLMSLVYAFFFHLVCDFIVPSFPGHGL